MANYAKLAATAVRLIKANGRSVTLVRCRRVPDESNKPWELNNSGEEEEKLEIDAVFVGQKETELGLSITQQTLLAQSKRVFITASNKDLSRYNYVSGRFDDNTFKWWKIDTIQSLQPAEPDLTLLSFVGISR